VALAVVLGATLWILIADRQAPPQEIGHGLFTFLAVLIFIYAGIFGTQVTADSLSEEKREGTLGLLFLTDLKGYDVVLGKLTATSLHSFYGMLTAMPVLAIPLLMGGVSRGEVCRAILVSVNLLFFSLSVGLFASALCRQGSRAHGLSVMMALAILFALPFVAQLERFSFLNSRVVNLSSPGLGCFLVFDNAYTGTSANSFDFWLNAIITQFYSWIFLGLTCWIVPRSWQDSALGKSSRWRDRRLSLDGPERRARLLAVNPFLWRASRPEFKRVAVWVLVGISAAFWAGVRWATGVKSGDGGDIAVNFAFLIWTGLMLKAWVASEAGRALGNDRRSGALELVMTTGLDPDQIVSGQVGAIYRQFTLPIVAMLLANLFFLMMELGQGEHQHLASDQDSRMIIYTHLAVGAFLALDCFALAWFGTWLGFKARKPNRSVLPALFFVVVLPALVSVFLCMPIFSGGGPESAVFFWSVIGGGIDVLLWVAASNKLPQQFRAIASEGFVRAQPVQEKAS
jgi:ABC-type transport system involved in multi-copper enzyme maturation permease subunit